MQDPYARTKNSYEAEIHQLRTLLSKATAVIDDMRLVDRHNSDVDFDVEELLVQLKVTLAKGGETVTDHGSKYKHHATTAVEDKKANGTALGKDGEE